MIAGHAKFSPDGNFGNTKFYISKSNCYSIIDVRGPNGGIQRSSRNILEIICRNLYTLERSFNWSGWQTFLKTKFGPCSETQKWHGVKVLDDSNDIRVASYLDDPFKSIKITNQSFLESYEVMTPQGLNEKRLEELELFKDFVLEEQKNHQVGNLTNRYICIYAS